MKTFAIFVALFICLKAGYDLLKFGAIQFAEAPFTLIAALVAGWIFMLMTRRNK